MDKKEKPGRNRDTSAATRARILRKRRRWAEELRGAGWSVEEPPKEEEPQGEEKEEERGRKEEERGRKETPQIRFLYS